MTQKQDATAKKRFQILILHLKKTCIINLKKKKLMYFYWNNTLHSKKPIFKTRKVATIF